MKIAVLGGGAMGALYGGYLSRKNDVTIVDVNTALIEKVKADGLKIAEPDGSSAVYHPGDHERHEGHAAVDLVIVFVKAMFSESALENNRALIGPDTYLMTLQNGSGHEDVLKRFADDAHVVIGTTQHNSAVVGLGEIRHGGSGMTHIGGVTGGSARLQPIAGRVYRLRAGGGLRGERAEADLAEDVHQRVGQRADGRFAGAAGLHRAESECVGGLRSADSRGCCRCGGRRAGL